MTPAKTVLLVDDEAAGLTARRNVLESLGYDVLVADSAYQAFSLFAHCEVDLAVLDYYLPDTNGGLLAIAMRVIKPRVPLILFSTSLSIPAEALSAVDMFVAKGESTLNLVRTIRTVLGGVEGAALT
jgi:CheY-like chemotaxis protein